MNKEYVEPESSSSALFPSDNPSVVPKKGDFDSQFFLNAEDWAPFRVSTSSKLVTEVPKPYEQVDQKINASYHRDRKCAENFRGTRGFSGGRSPTYNRHRQKFGVSRGSGVVRGFHPQRSNDTSRSRNHKTSSFREHVWGKKNGPSLFESSEEEDSRIENLEHKPFSVDKKPFSGKKPSIERSSDSSACSEEEEDPPKKAIRVASVSSPQGPEYTDDENAVTPHLMILNEEIQGEGGRIVKEPLIPIKTDSSESCNNSFVRNWCKPKSSDDDGGGAPGISADQKPENDLSDDDMGSITNIFDKRGECPKMKFAFGVARGAFHGVNRGSFLGNHNAFGEDRHDSASGLIHPEEPEGDDQKPDVGRIPDNDLPLDGSPINPNALRGIRGAFHRGGRRNRGANAFRANVNRRNPGRRGGNHFPKQYAAASFDYGNGISESPNDVITLNCRSNQLAPSSDFNVDDYYVGPDTREERTRKISELAFPSSTAPLQQLKNPGYGKEVPLRNNFCGQFRLVDDMNRFSVYFNALEMHCLEARKRVQDNSRLHVFWFFYYWYWLRKSLLLDFLVAYMIKSPAVKVVYCKEYWYIEFEDFTQMGFPNLRETNYDEIFWYLPPNIKVIPFEGKRVFLQRVIPIEPFFVRKNQEDDYPPTSSKERLIFALETKKKILADREPHPKYGPFLQCIACKEIMVLFPGTKQSVGFCAICLKLKEQCQVCKDWFIYSAMIPKESICLSCVKYSNKCRTCKTWFDCGAPFCDDSCNYDFNNQEF